MRMYWPEKLPTPIAPVTVSSPATPEFEPSVRISPVHIGDWDGSRISTRKLLNRSGQQPSVRLRRSRLVRFRGPPACPRSRGYEVEGVLGHGGMGVVYRARHLRLNRPVALKMLLAGPYAAPDERERFLREAEAVAALHHPNIVPVYDVGELDGRPYFTMELVEGGDLAGADPGSPQPARRGGRPGGRRWPTPSTRPTSAGSSTATSSRPTSCSPRRHAQGHRLRPGPAAGRRRGADTQRRRRWARPATWPPSRPGATRRHRAGGGRLRPGGDPVRAAHRPAAVPRRDRRWRRCSRCWPTSRCPRRGSTRGCRATWRRSA